jgi:2-isopropylmalate synthase
MKRKILLNDVVLRESAQVAGGAMPPDAQIRYVEYLVRNGIDIIEIGFPASSQDEFFKCQRIVQFVKSLDVASRPILSGLARAVESDISTVRQAGCDMVHIYIPASNQLMMNQFDAKKYGDTPVGKRQWMLNQAVSMVKYAKELGFAHIQYSPEDAARTGREFLCQIVEAVIDAGATSVNIPDTTGLCILGEFGDLINYIFVRVPNIKKARIACHCHNDSDAGTANALQGIVNGADEVQGTFYGLGERSGMTKFEAVIMNIQTRRDIFADVEIGFDSTASVEIVDFVAASLGMPIPRHWVVVGKQNSICSSGTHQAIEAKARKKGDLSPYYGWDPVLYGHGQVEIVLTQFSGKAGLSERLGELGFKVSKEQLEIISNEVNQISMGKVGNSLSDREITAIVGEVIKEIPFFMNVQRCTVIGGRGTVPNAAVRVVSQDRISEQIHLGNGPISALFDAVLLAANDLYPELEDVVVTLEDWRPVPVTVGNEALGDVYARMKAINSKTGKISMYTSHSVNVDTNQASVQAFANALSWAVADLRK